MDSLKKQRAIAKGSMTKLLTYVRSNLENASLDDIHIKQERVQRLLVEFQNIEKEMFNLECTVESDFPEFEDNYYAVHAGLNAIARKRSLATQKMSIAENSMGCNTTQHRTIEARLPKINIAAFEGDYLEWQSFMDLYSSTIHERENITAAQKFQYLKGLLKGEPLSLIRHLPVTDANYNEALQKLIKRYDRKRYTMNAFIKTYIEQPNIVQPNATSIRKLTDSFDEVTRGLKALGTDAEKRDPWLIYIALNKLDNETRSLWAQETAEKDFPTYDELLTFLGKRIDMFESIKGYTKKTLQIRTVPVTRAYSVDTSSGVANKCSICQQEGHRIYECDTYQGMNSEQRSEIIQRNNRCFNCLNSGHRVQDCRSRARCRRCYRKHHTSLHDSSNVENAVKNDHQKAAQVHEVELESSEVTCETPDVAELTTYTTKPATSRAILPTALVKIKDRNGRFRTYRALLDSASQACFISEASMQELKLERKNARILVKGLGEAGIGTTRGSTEITITSIDGKSTLTAQAFIIPKVSVISSPHTLSERDSEILEQLQLADPMFNQRGQIDLLLGVDIFFKILESKKVCLPSGLIAFETIFGWIAAGGSVMQHQSDNNVENFNVFLDIDNSLRKFWEIEELPKATKRTPDEQKCEELFQTTTKKAEDNKFIVKLPFKQPPSLLGTSYNAALNRLKTMERKFERDGEFGKMYKAFMAEYEELEHMEKVENHIGSCKYYIPHHGVLKASSTTTKLRVVFDASAKSSTGVSLNDILMIGPSVQPPLIAILLRFRQHEFVLCGDIEKMYRQVWLSNEDQRFQNILWRNNSNQQPSTYRLKTLTYGTASAAYLATRSLKEIGKQLQSYQSEAAEVILQDMYVDDMMTGANSTSQLKVLMHQVTMALSNNGFRMRKFLTNNQELRSFIRDQTTTEKEIKKIGEPLDDPKVLGLQWDPYNDVFKFAANIPEREFHSKRTLLSDASRTFDPLGWLSPIIIRVKILFQSIWMQNLSWDDKLPPNILEPWLKIKGDLCESTSVRVPRWLQSKGQLSLIGFSDASEKAYAAVIYAIVNTSNGLKSNIITAKSRVAPVKQISLPRLELMGALLLANLTKMVEESLKGKITNVSLFTDSKIVLDWLSAHPRRWTTFVANRTSEIIKLYKRERWFHVASKDNPADIGSRGIGTNELIGNKLWWHGPHWLTDFEETRSIHQSKNNTSGSGTMTTEELRPLKTDAFVIVANDFVENFMGKYSSFIRMTKILALLQRFIRGLRTRQRTRETAREEMQAAEEKLIRHIQQEFSSEIDALRNNKPLPRRSRIISLNPFIDGNGILRVGGRIQNSLASFNVKHPIILPLNHQAVKCIVRDAHLLHNHPGISLLTSIIRRKFWIIRGKVLSRAVVHKCIKCIKQNPATGEQIMGNLPTARVQYVHPFHKVGVDYCGPFKVQPVRRRGQVPMKVYVCIFVCLSTKAVHIEVVCNLTTESFIGALSRFTSRRGNCHTIYSDNGTNFVGANNQLKGLLHFLQTKASDIAAALLQYKINWKFIPPGAPHMGGIWESAVKQAKIHLGRVIGESILTLEEFSTLLTKIEAILNSRPIATSDAEEIDCITPAHFLIGRTFIDTAEETIKEQNILPMARWRLLKQMQQHFWKRWHREYLTILQKRSKWTTDSNNLTVGDIVLIAEAGLPSSCWALGKIVQTYPGNDNKIRVVDIRLANTNKIIQRPIHKLCKLPVQSYESTDSWPAEC